MTGSLSVSSNGSSDSLGVKNASPCFSQFTTYRNKPQGQKQYIQESVEVVWTWWCMRILINILICIFEKNIYIYVYVNILFGKKHLYIFGCTTRTRTSGMYEYVRDWCRIQTKAGDMFFLMKLRGEGGFVFARSEAPSLSTLTWLHVEHVKVNARPPVGVQLPHCNDCNSPKESCFNIPPRTILQHYGTAEKDFFFTNTTW